MRFYFFIVVLFFSTPFHAQQEKRLQFYPSFHNQLISIGESYYSPQLQDSIHFEALRFYISNVEFFLDGKRIQTLKKKHLLIDVEEPESMKIDLGMHEDLKFDQIHFHLGIDSLTNVSGAFGGDLDPTNGMYWAWQSGYINFKLEGVTNICPARNHVFQYHLGGYQSPFNALQKVVLKLNNPSEIIVDLAIDQFFHKINVTETYQIMSPGQQAVKLAQLVASIFSISE